MKTIAQEKAFTLIEIMVVVIIIGVMAAFGVPAYQNAVERQIASEGISLLTAIRGSQERYRIDNGAYTATIGDLDITIPASANYDTITALDGSTGGYVGQVGRSTGTYILAITNTGTVGCCYTDANICQKMGMAGDVCGGGGGGGGLGFGS